MSLAVSKPMVMKEAINILGEGGGDEANSQLEEVWCQDGGTRMVVGGAGLVPST